MDLTAYERITKRLERIEDKLDQLRGLFTQAREAIMADLDSLAEEVERNTAVDQSAITLLNGLAAQIESLKSDPAALQALVDDLRASSTNLANAVAANTPAEPSAP
jgi:prefoldin subunit 5